MIWCAGAVPVVNEHFAEEALTHVLSHVECQGSEVSLLACPHDSSVDGAECGPDHDAGVVCQGEWREEGGVAHAHTHMQRWTQRRSAVPMEMCGWWGVGGRGGWRCASTEPGGVCVVTLTG